MSRIDAEEANEVRAHIKGGGLHRIDLVEGHRFSGDDPGEVIGFRVFTRDHSQGRWKKRFVLWGNGDDTIRTLRSNWNAWLAGDLEAQP